ncbi:unnamed protein product [Blepharisma stoltei]|uniref:TmcB/TmcC TPR repeats domain-containing protein n=1 Tax=Blepharisma stoltei TaxID=1481888 RepID=A0AAU9KB65_9CILI|nr:unnamed protein product [Blepharisma stoltei]
MLDEDIDAETRKLFFSNKAKSWKKSKLCKLKNVLLDNLGIVFKPLYDNKTRQRSQYLVEIIINTINCFQILSFTWYPNMPISNWNHNFLVWKVLSYFSIDNMCSEMSVVNACYYGALSYLGLCLLGFIAVCVLSYLKRNIPDFFIYLISNSWSFFATIGFLPSFVLFLCIWKYSTFSYTNGTEFSQMNINDWNFGTPGAVISIIGVLVLASGSLVYEWFTADICHYHATKNLISKSNSHGGVNILFFKMLIGLMYLFLGYLDIVWYETCIIIVCAAQGYSMFKINSYYNPIMNSIKISRSLTTCLWTLSFILGHWLDDAYVIIFLNICFVPTIFALSVYILSHRSEAKLKDLGSLKNQYEFELQYRHLLVNKNEKDCEKVLDLFIKANKISMFVKDKLMVAWEVNYCIWNMKNIRLAKIKFVKMKETKSSIEGDIQEWRIMKIMDKYQDNLSIFSYLIELDRAVKKDEKLCNLLIMMWNEIIAKSPKLERLEKLSHKIPGVILNTKKQYEVLIDMKNSNVLEKYGTLLNNILCDYEKGNTILTKMKIVQKAEKHHAVYDWDKGSILISANSNDFGKIVIINDKAAEILKDSKFDIIGSDFTDYVPPPFQYGHAEVAKAYIENCKCPDVTKPANLWVLDLEGFIKECELSISLTTYLSHMYFVVSINLLLSTRQVALISEDGCIYCHSYLFPSYIGVHRRMVKHEYIQDLLPSLNFPHITPFQPVSLNFSGHELIVVYCTEKIKARTINFILVVRDQKEITSWMEGEGVLQSETIINIMNSSIANEINFQLLAAENEKVKFSFEDDNEQAANQTVEELLPTHSGDKKLKDDKPIDSSSAQNSSSQGNQNRGKVIINQLERTLKQFKIILILTIAAMVAMNIAIFIYIYDAVSHSLSVTVFDHLGVIFFRFISVAGYARVVDYSIFMNSSIEKNINIFNRATNDLDSIEDSILSDYEWWSYCKGSEIVNENLLNVWNFENEPKQNKMNLNDATNLYLTNARLFSKNAANSVDYKKQLMFLFANGLGDMVMQTNSSLSDLVDCEINRISQISNSIVIYLFIGISILGLCAIGLAGGIWFINKKYNDIWNFIRTITSASYFDLKSTCIDRLLLAHGVDYFSESDFPKKAFQEPLKFKVYWKYLKWLSVFFVTSTIYYIIVHAFLYSRCESLLKNRPIELTNYIQRRVSLSKIELWSREVELENTSISIQNLFPTSFDFKDPSKERDEALTFLKYTSWVLEVNIPTMYKSMKELVFVDGNSSTYYTQYGNYAAINIFAFDGLALQYNTDLESNMVWTDNLISLKISLQNNYQIINENSKKVITDERNLISYSVVVYSIFTVFLYFLFYLPILSRETKNLERFQTIVSLIPDASKAKRRKDT